MVLRTFDTDDELIDDIEAGVGPRRNWNKNRVPYSILGQKALCEFCGVPFERTNDRDGDGGIDRDLLLWLGQPRWIISDVKCTEEKSKGYYFLVNGQQTHPDHIYIAALHDTKRAELKGWVWGDQLLTGKFKFVGHREEDFPEAYHFPRADLHKMDDLKRILIESRPSTKERRVGRYKWHLKPRNLREKAAAKKYGAIL